MSAELTIAAYMVVLVASIIMSYLLGKADSKLELTQAELTVDALECTNRELRGRVDYEQCTVKHLRGEVDSVNGLWATDQPDLIKHHAKKERFFRIGYPEHRL